MNKPNFYKLLSSYLKLLVVSPVGVTVSESDVKQVVTNRYFDQFVEFLIAQCGEIGYNVIVNEKQYHIIRAE
jgi:hypothetical protein